MTDLAKCPCGLTPGQLHIAPSGDGAKYALASPSCCGEWMIEFRTDYKPLDSNECMEKAVKAWNEAPRLTAGIQKEIEGLSARQTRLDPEMEKILHKNLVDLYEQ